MRNSSWIGLGCALGLLACSHGESSDAGPAGGRASGVAAEGGGGAGPDWSPGTGASGYGASAGRGVGTGGASAAGRYGGGGSASPGGVGGAPPGGASGGAGAASGGGAGGAGSGVVAGGAAAGSGGDDRSAFFGESRCAAANFWLCEDFESGTLDGQRWQNKLSPPAIDSTRAARGQKALHLSTSATSGSGINTTKIFPTPEENYWGRLFVYFEQLPTAPTWAHWTIVGANPRADSAIKGEVRLGGQFDGTINRFGVGSDGGPTGDWTNLDADPKGAMPVPAGSWICLEWQHDGARDETRFYWDGVEHPSLGTTRETKHGGNSTAKFDLPMIGSIWFGFWNYDQGKTVMPDHFNTWIDEIALDGQRIGCTR